MTAEELEFLEEIHAELFSLRSRLQNITERLDETVCQEQALAEERKRRQ